MHLGKLFGSVYSNYLHIACDLTNSTIHSIPNKCEYACTTMFTAALFVKATKEINPMSIHCKTDKRKYCHFHVVEIELGNDNKPLLHAT